MPVDYPSDSWWQDPCATGAPAVDGTDVAGGRLEAVVPLPFLVRTLGPTLGRDVDNATNLAKAIAVQ
ncbi:hypothetical protein [Mycolicibacterium sp. YH-1]|uniref:hypothetical protein n=1 Tax=Mycolicibacterium sp. YH-1 TaxID=2908837 RepID=UPI001F4BF71E|nr:hypothetical protein [Mycolicibacterium sp. YH-1]UNB54400.1 hypothetical protein L0M16_08785 [Mycolicibacterium sp. YH-1]